LSIRCGHILVILGHTLRTSSTREEHLIVKFGFAAASAVVLLTSVVGSAAEARGNAYAQSGFASWYGPGFVGHRTANGERFRAGGYTAAHRSFPLGCHVLVTNTENGRSVVVRINDRGPYAGGRVIDLSYASARAIGMSGTARVRLARL
jgi:rare lipoprotein A